MKKILLLPKHTRLGASSRVRTLQYVPYLKSSGLSFDIYPLFSAEYLRTKNKKGRAGISLVLRAFFFTSKNSFSGIQV